MHGSSLAADLVMFPAWHSLDPLPIASLGISNLGTSQKKFIWENQQSSVITSLQLNPANKHIVLTGGTDGRVFVTNLSRYTAVLATDQPYAVNGMYSAGDVVTDARFFPNNPSAALCAALNGTISVFDVRARPDSIASSFNVHRSGLTGASFLDDFTVISSFDDGSVAPLDVRMGMLCQATADKFMTCASSVHADFGTGICVTTGDVGISVWKSKVWAHADDSRSWAVVQKSHHRAKAMHAQATANETPSGQYHVAGAFSSVQPGIFLAGDSHGNIMVLDTKSRHQSVRSSVQIVSAAGSKRVEASGTTGPMLVATAKSAMDVQRAELQATTPSTSSLSHSARVHAASSAVKMHRRQQKAVTVKMLAAKNSAALAASRAGHGVPTSIMPFVGDDSLNEPHSSSDGVVHNMWAAMSPSGGGEAGFKPSCDVSIPGISATPNTVIEVKTHVLRQPLTAVKVQCDALATLNSTGMQHASSQLQPDNMPPPSASMALPIQPQEPGTLPFAVFSASTDNVTKPSWMFSSSSDWEQTGTPLHFPGRLKFQAGLLAAASNANAQFALGPLAEPSSYAEAHDGGDGAHAADAVGHAIQRNGAPTPKAASAPQLGASLQAKTQPASAGGGARAPGSATQPVQASVAADTADVFLLGAPSQGNLEEPFAHGSQLASASLFDCEDELGSVSHGGSSTHGDMQQSSLQSLLPASRNMHPHEAAVGSSMTSAKSSLPAAQARHPTTQAAEGSDHQQLYMGETHTKKPEPCVGSAASASSSVHDQPSRGQKRRREAPTNQRKPVAGAEATADAGEAHTDDKKPRRARRSSARRANQ